MSASTRSDRRSLAGRAMLWFVLIMAGATVGIVAILVLAGRSWGDVLAGLAIAGAVGALAVWLMTRWIGGRLAGLVAAVERLGRGDLSFRAPAPDGAEVADLAASLNRMADAIQERIGRITEDRRTRDRVLSAMAEGVVLFRGDEVAYLNPAARRLLGAEPTGVRDVTPHALRRLVEEARLAVERREGRAEAGLPPRYLQAAAVPLGADQVLLVIRDVTEARRVEAMRRDFVADASHELKTPVASIHASAETLVEAMEDDPEAARRFALRMADESERLSRIVSDLLDLSRLEAGAPDMEPVRLDLLVEEEGSRMAGLARDAGIRLEVRAPDPVTVRGDRDDLGLLAANLLDNAVRYSQPGGSVRVEVRAAGDEAVLEVADSGAGIPTRDLPRVFERFYRVDRARSRDTGGTGLGLSIARHVVEQHGGRIEVESQLGRGSIFRVTLPVERETTGAGDGGPA